MTTGFSGFVMRASLYAGLVAVVTGCATHQNAVVPDANYDPIKHVAELAFRKISSPHPAYASCQRTDLEVICKTVGLRSGDEDAKLGFGSPKHIVFYGVVRQTQNGKVMLFALEDEKKKKVLLAEYQVKEGILHEGLRPDYVTETDPGKWQNFLERPEMYTAGIGFKMDFFGRNARPFMDLIHALGEIPLFSASIPFKNWQGAIEYLNLGISNGLELINQAISANQIIAKSKSGSASKRK